MADWYEGMTEKHFDLAIQEAQKSEVEGFYEKMWKDFVSLQRGDATKMCVDAARWRWLREQEGWPDSEAAVMGYSPEEFDRMADSGMTPNI